jgi:hypothetical protein
MIFYELMENTAGTARFSLHRHKTTTTGTALIGLILIAKKIGLILFAISMHGPNNWACRAHGSFRHGSGGVAEPEVLVPHRQLETYGCQKRL